MLRFDINFESIMPVDAILNIKSIETFRIYMNRISKVLCALMKAVGALLILASIYTILNQQFLIPINFLPKPFDFLNYPSVFTAIPSGIIILLGLESKKLAENSSMKILFSTVMILFCSVFGWEAIYHYAFPVYLNYFKYPFLNLHENNIYLFVGTFLASFVIYQFKQGIFCVTKYVRICFILFSVLFAFWILNGFPQYFKVGITYYPDMFNIGLKNSYLGILFLTFLVKILFSSIFILLLIDVNTTCSDNSSMIGKN